MFNPSSVIRSLDSLHQGYQTDSEGCSTLHGHSSKFTEPRVLKQKLDFIIIIYHYSNLVRL